MGGYHATIVQLHIRQKAFVALDQTAGHKRGLKAHAAGLYL